MKVYAISDLHLSSDVNKPMDVFGEVWENYWEQIVEDWEKKVTDEDVVLIAGDVSWGMSLEEAAADLNKIAALKGIKVLIRGNHDYWWAGISKIRAALPKGILVIQNDAVKIGSIVIAGSRGWTVPELGVKSTEEDLKLFERERLRLEMSMKAAEKLRVEGDALLVMTHFPPFNSRFENSVYTDLFRSFKATAVVYGHLHGKSSRIKLTVDKDGIPYYLTSCDRVSNKLVEII